jgi:YegS/Rv2252/BmrU family lipid kinase
MLYIHFIVNPISGNGKHIITRSTLRTFFPADMFRIEVDYTEHKKHATELTKKAVANNPDCIVACGGDGTINEVASCLINTSVKLGIIPVGSGNGLSAHLQIPKSIDKALQIIINGQSTAIDVGKLNEKYFFSNMGVGIDAMIIKNYERSGKRTLTAYIKASLTASTAFKTQKAILSFNNKVAEENPFMLFISNSNEMGYNMSLTPKASLKDGMLDLIIVPQLSFSEKLALGYYVLRNKVDKFKKAHHTLVDNLHMELPEKIFTDAQIDGEYHNLKTNSLKVSIIKHGLEVIIP